MLQPQIQVTAVIPCVESVADLGAASLVAGAFSASAARSKCHRVSIGGHSETQKTRVKHDIANEHGHWHWRKSGAGPSALAQCKELLH